MLSSRPTDDGRYVVSTKLVEYFFAGTAYLDYRFTLRDGLIGALEIAT